MKKAIISGAIVIVLGLLIALGPQFLFKVCAPMPVTEEAESVTEHSADAESAAEQSAEAPDNADPPRVVSYAYSHCHWSAQAEIGLGLLIVALGGCMLVFTDRKTHLGLLIGIALASIIALAVPHFLIGGCRNIAMKCHRVAFPALTVESAVLLVFSAIMITVIAMEKPQGAA